MRTIRTKVYQFSELSEQAKKVAIEKERDDYWKYGEPLFMFEDYCKERAKEQGFNECTFRWSLSYCQGDGLSFTCTDFDTDKFIPESIPDEKKLLRRVLKSNLNFTVKQNNGHYAYASKSDCDLILDTNKDYSNIEAIVDTMRTKLENKYMNLCKELEKEGYSWIESENEDTAIIDRLEANEYEFTADGRRF
jgi:hypothetical protein